MGDPAGVLPRQHRALETGLSEAARRALPAQAERRARHQGRPAAQVRRCEGSHEDDQGRGLPERRPDRGKEGRRARGEVTGSTKENLSMAMAAGGMNDYKSDINITPLVDVV